MVTTTTFSFYIFPLYFPSLLQHTLLFPLNFLLFLITTGLVISEAVTRGEHWWDLINFESILFLDSLVVSLYLKYLVQSSKWRVELGVWEVVFFPVPEEIVYIFLVYLRIVQIWSMHHSLDKRVWFTIIFLPLKESLTLFQIWAFYYTFKYFVPFGVIENRVNKVNSKYLM